MTNDSLSSLKLYLETQVSIMRKFHPSNWKYGGFEELVMDYGTIMAAKPLPPKLKPGYSKQCYFNCQKLAFQRKSLSYVEGFAISEGMLIPLAHAWLLTSEGNVLDPTWDAPGSIYLGVPFHTKWVKSFLFSRQQRNQTDNLSIFEGNYLEDYSLLKEGLPVDAYWKHVGNFVVAK